MLLIILSKISERHSGCSKISQYALKSSTVEISPIPWFSAACTTCLVKTGLPLISLSSGGKSLHAFPISIPLIPLPVSLRCWPRSIISCAISSFLTGSAGQLTPRSRTFPEYFHVVLRYLFRRSLKDDHPDIYEEIGDLYRTANSVRHEGVCQYTDEGRTVEVDAARASKMVEAARSAIEWANSLGNRCAT